jgi:hypothetical protein
MSILITRDDLLKDYSVESIFMLLGIHALLVLGVLVVELYCLVLGFTQSCAY